jgi:cobalt-precorrin 5A hydrolase
MIIPIENKTAIWAITPNGLELAEMISGNLSGLDVYISRNIEQTPSGYFSFQTLSETLPHKYNQYSGHIFIMSTGIVVRVIAPLLKSKLEDPAVVVVDDQANHAISLLSGHIGGANALTRQIADIIGADPVITTATDVNRLPAIDMLAKEKNLLIDNPRVIKTVNMALLKGEEIFVHDPYGFLGNSLPNSRICDCGGSTKNLKRHCQIFEFKDETGVYIDDIAIDLPPQVLVLRPASLVAGIGCNRNTGTDEIQVLLGKVLETNNLVAESLKCIASIDVKSDESGLINLSENLNLPLIFYKRQELNRVKTIKNPSLVVEKHVGVKSVCEAAAILAAGNGSLIVPKQTTRNVTVAIARIDFS